MLKRIFDILASGTALLLLSPVMVVVAAMIWRRMGLPIFFAQTRPGRGGKPFRMLKFRTMMPVSSASQSGAVRSDAQRLTPLGRWLRATSLDELPELWNVLKGDMSLVGPRPLLMDYLPLYSPEQARRHDVRPGITGWAQINGRNALDWPQRFQLDVWYVDHQSFWLDVKILLKTVMKVVKREGISAEGEATMPPFTGQETPNNKEA